MQQSTRTSRFQRVLDNADRMRFVSVSLHTPPVVSLLRITNSSFADMPPGGDIAFDIRVMEGYRRFCNKIYQANQSILYPLLLADFYRQPNMCWETLAPTLYPKIRAA